MLFEVRNLKKVYGDRTVLDLPELDFDKGRIYRGSREKLKDRYIARWQRAVAKHGLPEFLAGMMQEELNESLRLFIGQHVVRY